MVVEDNSVQVFHDKNMISADRYASSPNRDNVYVTWTVFRFDRRTAASSESPIYGSMSTDHGHHLVDARGDQRHVGRRSASSATRSTRACDPHKCNFDQGSYSVALPNGDLEVIFNNGNTPAGNPNAQQLGVHCTRRAAPQPAPRTSTAARR